jgi:hypothetical protein
MTEQERRYVCRLLDLAVERCEEGNLREHLAVPRWVADLVVQLQAAADDELRIPTNTIVAHGELLDLRRCYMPTAPAYDREKGAAEACQNCGRELRQDSQEVLCTHCRTKRKLEASHRPKVGAAR